jgi:hypothetical protein
VQLSSVSSDEAARGNGAAGGCSIICTDETFTPAHKTAETLPKPLQWVSVPFTN